MNEQDKDAARVREIFERAPQLRCPDELRDRILAAVDVEEARSIRRAPRTAPRHNPFKQRWLWGATAVAALLLALLLPGRLQLSTGEHETLTQAEIETTRAEVETAFALISDAFDRSTQIVDEQIRENVIRPVFKPSVRSPAHPPASLDEERSSGLSLPPRDGVSVG